MAYDPHDIGELVMAGNTEQIAVKLGIPLDSWDELPPPGPTPKTVYHRTDAADAILAEGFRDAEGSYMMCTLSLKGVWVSDVPVDANEGANGRSLLAITVGDGVDFSEYEVIESMPKGFREWCVPAALLNERCTVALVDVDDAARG